MKCLPMLGEILETRTSEDLADLYSVYNITEMKENADIYFFPVGINSLETRDILVDNVPTLIYLRSTYLPVPGKYFFKNF